MLKYQYIGGNHGDFSGRYTTYSKLVMSFQGDSIYWVEVEKVVPNPFQPRHEFDEQKLRELGESIRMYGVLQPLTVTRKEVQREDGTFYTEYELIAGERRLRASKLAGVSQVPVIIRDGEQTEQEKLELAIIENLQREDLNAVDRALAFKQLADQFKLSHVQVAQKVGRSREYVSNSIRLLALPENILDAVKGGSITEGHARTLLMLNDRPEEQQVVFEEAKLKKLSVRDVEKIARGIATEKVRKKTLDNTDTELMEMEKKFTETLGTRVQIHKTEFGGRLAIDYFTVEDLETILRRIKEEEAEAAEQSATALQDLVDRTPLETVPATRAEEPEVATAPLHSVSALNAAVLGMQNTPDPTSETPDTTAQMSAIDQLSMNAQGRSESNSALQRLSDTESVSEPEYPTALESNNAVPSQASPREGMVEPISETVPDPVPTPQSESGETQRAGSVGEPVTQEPSSHSSQPTDDTLRAVDEPDTDKTDDDTNLYSINNFTV